VSNATARTDESAIDVTSGRRMLICGLPGSGKTTLARKLAAANGLPVIEADPLQFDRNWRYRPVADRVRDTLAALTEHPDGWIYDGTFPVTHELVLDLCDTLVWLRPPLAVVWLRLIRRQAIWSWRREHRWGALPVTWRRSFCNPNAGVWWAFGQRNAYHRWIAHSLEASKKRPHVIVLRTDGDIAALVARAAELQRSPEARATSAASSPECTQSAMPTPR
jgi:hypothetical protein